MVIQSTDHVTDDESSDDKNSYTNNFTTSNSRQTANEEESSLVNSEQSENELNKNNQASEQEAPHEVSRQTRDVKRNDGATSNGDIVESVHRSNSAMTGAASARDLVRGQERLLDMLHSMNIDICRMDREASRIKEDVVKSNQLFDVVVNLKETHHLPVAMEGFNMSYSIPRVTYPRQYLNRDTPTSIHHLNQLSTFRKDSYYNGLSHESSVSPEYATACNVRVLNRRSIQGCAGNLHSGNVASRRDRRSTHYPAYDINSGTESDIESTASTMSNNWSSSYRHAHNESHDSDSTYDAGSSTESASTCGEDSVRYQGNSTQQRRSSYFYTPRVATPPQALSDEVDM